MNILIVEDNQSKLTAITSVILEVSGASEIQISKATCIVDAKRLLQSTVFDLLLLDIRLPMRSGERPKPNGWLRGSTGQFG